MGKLSHEPFLNHFSHPHQLELLNLQTLTNQTPPCAACRTPLHGWIYACRQCVFNLHGSCSQLPQFISHPSHPSHTLTLIPIPAYHGGRFSCDACATRGSGFSYHCSNCDFDLHALCASKPLVISHASHPHRLTLAFAPPYETRGFSCDICRKVGVNQWLYRCGPCGFDPHTSCVSAANTTAPPLLHQSSLPMPHTVQPPSHNQHFSYFPLSSHNTSGALGLNQNQGGMANVGFQNLIPAPQTVQQPPQNLQHAPSFPFSNYNTPGALVVNHNHGGMANQGFPNQAYIVPNRPANTVNGYEIQGVVQGVMTDDGSDTSSVSNGAEPYNDVGQGFPNQYAAVGVRQDVPYQHRKPGQPNVQSQAPEQIMQPQNNPNAAGGNLMSVMVQGFVQGAAEQVGQNFVQSVMGGGDDGGGGNDGGFEVVGACE